MTEGDVLQYGYDGKWHNVQLSISGSGGGSDSPSGASKLSELSDVLLSSVYDGQVLTWDASLSKWKNKAVPSTPTGDEDDDPDNTDYLTQAEADLRYLKLTGGTITGDLLVTGDITFHNT
ncbi:MAG: hypothetical protein IKY26_00790 [Erysipelotrichaceae bacterium]|nr:hypothetical protein [Erysipelotrichaceae bacterium]